MTLRFRWHLTIGLVAAACIGACQTTTDPAGRDVAGPPVIELPAPGPVVFRAPNVVGWADDEAPVAPVGFVVERFASGLANPRWPYALPNGDVLVSQARTESLGGLPPDTLAQLRADGLIGGSPNSIQLLRPTSAGVESHTLVDGLNQPFGLLLHGEFLYVANTDALVRFAYAVGDTRITSEPEFLLTIPAGEKINPWNNHWTRNLAFDAVRERVLITVGSGTNVNKEGVDPPDRAAVWSVRPDGTDKRIVATGLRNPVGLAVDPRSGKWWTTVNERDGLGEEHPPDYLAEVVDGADYGWPYVYFGTYPDPTHAELNPDRVVEAQRTARAPDLSLGGHTVPLGLLFYGGDAFPRRYAEGAFIARRGGVSRADFLGFDVVFLPFANGRPTGDIEPFLTGFVADYDAGTVRGRPVGLAELPDGSIVVTDDAGKIVWRVVYKP